LIKGNLRYADCFIHTCRILTAGIIKGCGITNSTAAIITLITRIVGTIICIITGVATVGAYIIIFITGLYPITKEPIITGINARLADVFTRTGITGAHFTGLYPITKEPIIALCIINTQKTHITW
jgi:hypothetical protein